MPNHRNSIWSDASAAITGALPKVGAGAGAGAGAGEPSPAKGPALPRNLNESSREYERGRMEAALVATGGNKTKAARMLGVPLRTFMAKIKRHGIR